MPILQRLLLLFSFLMLGTAVKLHAQTTWTGNASSAWSNAANWTAGVPTASADALIPDVANDPVISDAGAIAQSVSVGAGASLTINPGASLAMNGSGVQALSNEGTVQNSGTITIGNTSAVGIMGVFNKSVFNNNAGAVLNIDGVSGDESVALFNIAGAQLSNQGTINIGRNSASGSYGLGRYGNLVNANTGQIFIDRVTHAAITGIGVDNSGEITVGSVAAGNTMERGFEVIGSVKNNASGRITIDRVNSAVQLGVTNNFLNSGTVTIGKETTVPDLITTQPGNILPARFDNQTGGTFEATGNMDLNYEDQGGTTSPGATAGAAGRLNFTSTAEERFNTGILKMDINGTGAAGIAYDQVKATGTARLGGTLALAVNYAPAAGDRFLLMTTAGIAGTFATVTGLPTGWNLIYTATEVILSFGEVAQTTWTGAVNSDWHTAGNWSNGVPGALSDALIPDVANDPVIGTGNASAQSVTVQTGATLTVNASRTLTIDKSFENGLVNKGTVHNSGEILIGVNGDINLAAVLNEGTFNNNAGASILINRAAAFGSALANSAGIFNNAGLITIGAAAGAAQYGLHSTGIFTNLPTGALHIDRTTVAAIYNAENRNFYNQGKILIGQIAAAGTNGIENHGTFISELESAINIDRVSNAAIYHVGTTVRNWGNLTIGALADGNPMVFGIYAEQQITNSVGTIRIDRVNTAIALQSSSSTSSSNIIIGESSDVPVMLSGAGSGLLYNEGGLFKGSGIIYGTRFQNTSGTIAPGAPVGKIKVQGDLVMNANTIIPIEVTGSGNAGVDYDQLEITGTAALNGRLNLSITFSPEVEERIIILKAGVLSGAFTTVTPLPVGWELLSENNSLVLHYYAAGSTTWTGAVNTDWAAPGNWTNQVPAGNMIAVIPDVTNDPVISTTTAVAGAVFVSGGASLTINSGAVLTLEKAYSPGIHSYGTVQNSGTITIGSTSAAQIGINNAGVFHNYPGAKINIDRTTSTGILNSTDSFFNAGTINIGANAAAGQNGIVDEVIFTNLSGGQINIDRVSNAGIYENGTAFDNRGGVITIGAQSGGNTMPYGIYVTSSDVSNLEAGVINIDRVHTGIYVLTSSYTNRGLTALGASTTLVNLIDGSTLGSFYNYQGVLKASGSIAPARFLDDRGTLSPGFPIGKITFTGTEALQQSNIALDINGASTAGVDYDQIAVNGTATLGGKLALTINYAGKQGDQIPIVTATSVSGTFSTVTGLAPNWTLVYSANAVSLVYGSETVWTGSESTDWNTAGNWTAGIPTAELDVIIPDAGNDPVVPNAGAVAKSITVQNGGVLTINAAGVLTLNGSADQAILNKGSVDNHGTIHIGSVSAVGTSGIRNESIFNNLAGGTVHIDRSTSTAIRNAAGVFSNDGTIRIGANAASGSDGINNIGVFSNNPEGRIFIDRTTSVGIYHNGTSFNNQGSVTIGALADGNTINYGIYISQYFQNAGGQINIDRVNMGIATGSGTFSNAGAVHVGASTAVPTLLTAEGTGTFSNNTEGEIKGNNTIAAARFVNSGGKLSPGNSPGKLTFDADEDFSNSIVAIEVNEHGTPGVDFDQIVVNGTATLGGTLNVTIGYTWQQEDQLTIISAQSISGTFSTVTGLPATWEIGYTANAVTLTAIYPPLPVTLVSFNAAAVANSAELQWRTTSETNNKGFFIEHSQNGQQWSDIGFVDGNATTSSQQDYRFRDSNPGKGINYYRLRQVDFNGKTEHSRIAAVRFEGSANEVTVWLDANRRAQIRTEDQIRQVNVFDLSGKVLMVSDQPSLDLTKAPAGMLLIRVETSLQTVTRKLVLN